MTYFRVFTISVILLIFIWIRPTHFVKNQNEPTVYENIRIEEILTDTSLGYDKSFNEPETPDTVFDYIETPKNITTTVEKDGWGFLTRTNEIMTFIIGLVNIYFLIRKKRGKTKKSI